MSHYIIVDIDRENSFIYWKEIDFLRPTIIVQNKENKHSHYLYEIDQTNISLTKLDLAHESLKYYLNSHKVFSYQKQLAKNCLSNNWNSFYFDRIYDTKELIGDYNSSKKNINRNLERLIVSTEKIYEGERNNYLFNVGRKFAYKNCKEENLFNLVFSYISNINEK
jgi:hypothetical protein